jgi:hypothetical protein
VTALADMPRNATRDATGLRQVFEWFRALGLLYETVSNHQLGVHVKTAGEMADSVRRGFGGHCVEHAVLLAAILGELGYDARFANADHHDRVRDVSIEMAKALVLVTLDEGTFACDPYYTRAVVPLPDAGRVEQGRYAVWRLDARTCAIDSLRRGAVVSRDVVREDSTIDDRRRLFAERYVEFSPFGVTAPWFQLRGPVRRGLYYDPLHDAYLEHDDATWRHLSASEVVTLGWVPERVRRRVPVLGERNRAERDAAARFLETGAYVPYYRQLRPASAVEPGGER